MRRRRPQLQVSLFPFLSVLLCTLGALVLLLLVLDQKARVSRAAEAAAEQQAARDLRIRQLLEARARTEAEVKERADKMRASRAELEQDRAEKQRTQAAARANLDRSAGEAAALERLLAEDEARLGALARQHAERAAESQRVSRDRAAASDERDRLLEQVQRMEQLIAQIRDANQRRSPVYSLVPYKGKRGTGRQPVYMECIGEQIVFRPDGGRLALAEAQEPGKLQAELERRFAGLPLRNDQDKPYALLLIRPSGVSLYYAVLAALRKTQVDVGYEFLDEDWVLDFSGRTDSVIAKGANADAGSSAGGAGTGSGGNRRTSPRPEQSGEPGAAGGSAATPAGAVRPRGASGPTLSPLPTRLADTGSAPGERAPPGAKQAGGQGPSPVRSDEVSSADMPPQNTSPAASRSADAGAGSESQTPPKQMGGGPGAEAETTDNRPRLTRPTPLGASANEWNILIECTATRITFKNAGQTYSPQEVAGADNPLLALIRRQIEQKRGRNPDLRPRLKYLIHEDALRSYYAAAGALESLHLPTTWEVVKE